MSNVYFKPLTEEELQNFGAPIAGCDRAGDWRDQGPNKFIRPEEAGMKHRVHYSIIGIDGSWQMLTQRTFDNRVPESYVEFCQHMERLIAQANGVEPKDVVLTLVWNL